MIHSLFACPLLIENLKIKNTALKIYIQGLAKKSKGREISNEGGWQSNNIPFMDDMKIFGPLCKEIIFNSQRYIVETSLNNDKKYGITNMWANVNKYKDSNIIHCHPFSVISGVYYVKVPENSGGIEFVHPEQAIGSYYVHNYYEKLTPINSATWMVNPKEGDLLLFPSFLRHRVTKHLNKKEDRITLAFNIADYKLKWIE